MLRNFLFRPLSTDDSALLKGVAVCAVVFHHVLAFPERWPDFFREISVFPVFVHGLSLESVCAKAAAVSVSVFLFVTGYGFAARARNADGYRKWASRFIAFLSRFWLVVALYVPLGIWLHRHWGGGSNYAKEFLGSTRFVWNTEDFVLTLLGFSERYNSEWWFVGLYLMCLLTMPVLLRVLAPGATSLLKVIFLFIVSLSVFSISSRVDFWPLVRLSAWIFPVLTGIVCCRCAQEGIRERVRFLPGEWALSIFLVAIYPFARMGFARKFENWGIPPSLVDSIVLLVCVPVFCKSRLWERGVGLFVRKIFEGLGREAIWIWLVHSFYCYYFFDQFVYSIGISIVVFMCVMLMSLVSAWFLNGWFLYFQGCLIKKIR
ncbi:acyltransferase family protein [Uliginosibacterium sp. H3]|uniref:Acyltransferase family protein n=1 Tax=Uliginosibacterium silvisoli TaxID=3114758 RepID=A0ABU6JY51_9RHOO|nr:acyltransferase family protein [Uliginosibacterium sp. H3]